MKSKLTEKVYKYVWEKDSLREAEIRFTAQDGVMKFRDCKYTGVNAVYSADDWSFLKDLACEIEELINKKDK